MRRRGFPGATAASFVAPGAVAQPAIGGKATTLIHAPQANLTSLDPVWTTAVVTRNFAHMVFETLYGRDENINPLPQMVEGHQVSYQRS